MTDDELTIYHDGIGWRWRLQSAGNHRIIGASTEAYASRAACVANAARVLDVNPLWVFNGSKILTRPLRVVIQ